MQKLFRTIVILTFTSSQVYAAQYDCLVSKKFDTENAYTAKQISDGQFSIKITDQSNIATISRCSFTMSEGKVTCDTYDVDKIVYDENVKIKKFYIFRSQFDVQMFSNLSFIENNGRGGISFGKCTITTP